MNRRKFLQLTGLSIAGVAVGVPETTVIKRIQPFYTTVLASGTGGYLIPPEHSSMVIDFEGFKHMTVMKAD